MGIGILLGFVFAAIAIGLVIGAYKCWDNAATAGQVTCNFLDVVLWYGGALTATGLGKVLCLTTTVMMYSL